MRGVQYTDLSNGRIIGKMSSPLVQKRIKGGFNTYQMQITSSKTVNYIFFTSKNVQIEHRSFHPSGVFSVAPVAVKYSGGGCLMR